MNNKLDFSRVPVARYLRASDTGHFDAAITYSVISDDDGNTHVYGAYYGNIGGGDYDGGYFHLAVESGDCEVLSYDEAEASDYSALFNRLMGVCGGFSSDEDPEQCTDDALDLLDSVDADDGVKVFMDDEFDGDALSELSEMWELMLRFES